MRIWPRPRTPVRTTSEASRRPLRRRPPPKPSPKDGGSTGGGSSGGPEPEFPPTGGTAVWMSLTVLLAHLRVTQPDGRLISRNHDDVLVHHVVFEPEPTGVTSVAF